MPVICQAAVTNPDGRKELAIYSEFLFDLRQFVTPAKAGVQPPIRSGVGGFPLSRE
jgi:hypothetical protein